MNRSPPEADPSRSRPRFWRTSPSPAVLPRSYSIRAGLIALVAACALPSLVALGVIAYGEHLQREEVVKSETMLRAKEVMATIDRDLAKVEASLEVLAASGRLSAADLSSFVARLRTTPRSDVIVDYLLIDRAGRALINTDGRRDEGGATGAAPAAPQRVFETGESFVSALYGRPGDGQPRIAVTVPVRRNGEVVYALVAELSPAVLGAMLVKDPLPDDWVAVLLDDQGTIVSRSRFADRYAGQRASAVLRAASDRRLDGTLDALNRENVPVITSFTRSSLSGLKIAVNAPRSLLVTRLSRSFVILIGGGSLVLLGALWFARKLAGNISRSVEGLIKPALALGRGRTVELPASRLSEADAVGRALVEASAMLAEANHQAHHDALTGLCNRVLFDELAAHQIAAAQRSGQSVAVLAIDLDRFKEVNDRHGHAAGDRVLTMVAERIRQGIRAADIVSRRGGDEFTVLLLNVDPLLTQRIGSKLIASLAIPYAGIEPAVSASIGVASYPESGTTLPELLERADRALYDAKHGGKRRLAGDAVDGQPNITRIIALA